MKQLLSTLLLSLFLIQCQNKSTNNKLLLELSIFEEVYSWEGEFQLIENQLNTNWYQLTSNPDELPDSLSFFQLIIQSDISEGNTSFTNFDEIPEISLNLAQNGDTLDFISRFPFSADTSFNIITILRNTGSLVEGSIDGEIFNNDSEQKTAFLLRFE